MAGDSVSKLRKFQKANFIHKRDIFDQNFCL